MAAALQNMKAENNWLGGGILRGSPSAATYMAASSVQ